MNTTPDIKEAVFEIDSAFGKGYAKEHSSLIGTFLVSKALQELDETFSTTAQQILKFSSMAGPLLKFLK